MCIGIEKKINSCTECENDISVTENSSSTKIGTCKPIYYCKGMNSFVGSYSEMIDFTVTGDDRLESIGDLDFTLQPSKLHWIINLFKWVILMIQFNIWDRN